jgi:hypothetical protein
VRRAGRREQGGTEGAPEFSRRDRGSTGVRRAGRREQGESTGVLGEGPREHLSSGGGTEAAARPRTVPRAPDAHGTKSTGGATEAAKHEELERKPPPRAGSGSRRTERRGRRSERALGLGLHGDGVRVFARTK